MMMMSISKLLTRSRMHGCVCICVGGGDGGLACKTLLAVCDHGIRR